MPTLRQIILIVPLALAALLFAVAGCGGEFDFSAAGDDEAEAQPRNDGIDETEEISDDDAGGHDDTQEPATTGALVLHDADAPLESARIHTEALIYEHEGTTLEGFVAYDTSLAGPRPGVVIVHQWRGLSDYERRRARQLAALGYVGFAVDIYGQGVRPRDSSEARETAGSFYADRELLRGRAAAGLQRLREFEQTDAERTAAIGYCFGGTTVLELAQSGADIDGVISFHGGFNFPDPQDFANISGRVLIAHGAEDPAANLDSLWETIGYLREHEVSWRLSLYSDAVHSFTQREAGDDPSRGSAYDETADRLSWLDMQVFFDELWSR